MKPNKKIKFGSKMRLTSISMVLLMQLVVSCASFWFNLYGFLAFVTVDTRGYSKEYVANAKSEFNSYLEESLGMRKSASSFYYGEPLSSMIYLGSTLTVVYFFVKDSYYLHINLRDYNRNFPKSKELKGEIEGILTFLREKFGEDNVTFEQQSTFLA